MAVNDTMVDDTKTSAKRWEGWRIIGFLPEQVKEVGHKEDRKVFTKQDFEQALQKAARKVKS